MNSCQQYQQFLSQFNTFALNPDPNHAYQIKKGDRVDYIDSKKAELTTQLGGIKFNYEQQVSLGDFIVLGGVGAAYHVSQTLFKKLHLMTGETPVLPGQPVIEEHYEGNPVFWHSVIKINDRYFSEIKNGRVRTAWCIEGAKKFETRHNPVAVSQMQKVVAELQQKKKNPKVLEVGYWSRDIAESEGGAA